MDDDEFNKRLRRKDSSAPSYSFYQQNKQKYTHYNQKVSKAKPESEFDIVRKHMKFIHDDHDDDGGCNSKATWEKRVAKKYHDKLYKEFALCKFGNENQVGLRWRTEGEVLKGKGERICGNLDCKRKEALQNYETIFNYREDGTSKSALVKVCLCEKCLKKMKKRKRKRDEDEEEQIQESEKDEPEVEEMAQNEIEDVWKEDKVEDKKTKEEEFDDFFNSLK